MTDIDEAAIERRINGDNSVRLTRDERLVALRQLWEQGLTDPEIGAAIGTHAKRVAVYRAQLGLATKHLCAREDVTVGETGNVPTFLAGQPDATTLAEALGFIGYQGHDSITAGGSKHPRKVWRRPEHDAEDYDGDGSQQFTGDAYRHQRLRPNIRAQRIA